MSFPEDPPSPICLPETSGPLAEYDGESPSDGQVAWGVFLLSLFFTFSFPLLPWCLSQRIHPPPIRLPETGGLLVAPLAGTLDKVWLALKSSFFLLSVFCTFPFSFFSYIQVLAFQFN